MADFHQNGNIAQFHNLRARSLEELEYELTTFAQTRKISLILPCLYSELEGPALRNILQEVAQVPYLNHIVIGLDRATEAEFRHAREFFSVLPQPHTVVWNDSPRMQAVGERLALKAPCTSGTRKRQKRVVLYWLLAGLRRQFRGGPA